MGLRAGIRHRATPWLAAGLLLAVVGCGGKFSLPPQETGTLVPPNRAFTYKGGLDGLDEISDVLITRSSGNQLLVVRGALADGRVDCAGELVPGAVEFYPIFARAGTPPLSLRFDGLWRPRLAAESGGVIFIYDAGDSCQRYSNPDRAPYVRLYRIGQNAPTYSFTDTAWAEVRGLAASPDHTVYVSGTFRVKEPDEFGRFTLRFRDGIWRYKESNGYQHRDNWAVLEGSGTGFVSRQQGIAWGPPANPFLWVVDGEKQSVQKLAIETDSLSHGIYQIDGSTSDGGRFQDPVDVAADDSGYVYIVDRGTARVERYYDRGDQPEYVQKINLNVIQGEPHLLRPAAAAVLDTIVYVGDPGLGAALRYERRR